MGWSFHLRDRHAVTERELSDAARDQTPLVDLHEWLHVEYQARLDHWHDIHGQLVVGSAS
jgi:hypothetical protein